MCNKKAARTNGMFCYISTGSNSDVGERWNTQAEAVAEAKENCEDYFEDGDKIFIVEIKQTFQANQQTVLEELKL